MRTRHLHSWKLTPRQAVEVQRQLAGRVVQGPPLEHFSLVAGADVSFDRPSRRIYAGIVVCRGDSLEVIERTGVMQPESFPYVPGSLSFREAPALLEAFTKLSAEPDVVLFDGQGLAHPRRFGLACHMGLLLERPSIGCQRTHRFRSSS